MNPEAHNRAPNLTKTEAKTETRVDIVKAPTLITSFRGVIPIPILILARAVPRTPTHPVPKIYPGRLMPPTYSTKVHTCSASAASPKAWTTSRSRHTGSSLRAAPGSVPAAKYGPGSECHDTLLWRDPPRKKKRTQEITKVRIAKCEKRSPVNL